MKFAASPQTKRLLAAVLLVEAMVACCLRAAIWRDTGLNWRVWLLVVVATAISVIAPVSAVRLVRRRMQFSLKALLVLISIAAVCVAGVNSVLHRMRDRQRAIAALETRGGRIYFETGRRPTLNRLIDKWLLGDVVEVYCDARITRDDMVFIEPLTTVRRLTLSNQTVTDADLMCLRPLSRLETLHLDGTSVTGEGLDQLQTFRSLRDLTLWGTALTDAGLRRLSQMHGLVWLRLSLTNVGDDGLRYLSGLERLKWLGFDSALVTDEGLAHLRNLRRLEELYLNCPCVTDAGLEHLKALPMLNRLGLNGCQISDEALKRFQREMPGTITKR
jgi:hypothetical protein